MLILLSYNIDRKFASYSKQFKGKKYNCNHLGVTDKKRKTEKSKNREGQINKDKNKIKQ